MTYERMALPVTTPLAEQDPFPPGLPDNWYDLSSGQQAHHLRNKAQLLWTNTYLSAALETGVRKLDEAATAAGKAAVHQTAFCEVLDSEPVHASFAAGNTEHNSGPIHTPGLEKIDRRLVADAGGLMSHIDAYFGKGLCNPALMRDICGYNRMHNKISRWRGHLYSQGIQFAMNESEWPPHLRAFLGVQYMHQAAGRGAKALASPLLDPKTTIRAPEGGERQFWQGKLAGSSNMLGMAYYLGYREKSNEELTLAMRRTWGEDYTRNRGVFVTALNILMADMDDKKERQAVSNKVRRPVFQLIGQGDFRAAHTHLLECADERPDVFTLYGLKFLGRLSKLVTEPSL